MAQIGVIALLARLLEGTDEALNPIFDRVAEFFARYLTGNSRILRTIIGRLSPLTLAAIKHAGPVVVSGAIGVLLPDSLFASPQRAATVKNVLVRFVTKIADAFEADGFNQDTVDRALREVLDAYVIMHGGHYHDPKCTVVPERLRNLYEEYMRDNDPGRDRNRRYRELLRHLITLAQALETSKAACAHCGHRTNETAERQQQAAAAKPRRAPRSALDVIGMLNEEQRSEFNEWLGGLGDDDLRSAMSGLAELDSVEEAVGFLALDPELRLVNLPLLENRSTASHVKATLGFLGGLVSDGYDVAADAVNTAWQDMTVKAGEAWDAAKVKAGEIDDGLQPAVTATGDYLQQLQQPPPPPPQRTGFLGVVWKVGGALKGAGRWLNETVFP
jgi:hypothetical protein